MYKQINAYFKKHTMFNSLVHMVGGIGVGIIVARPFAAEHPIRWGIALIILAILGHLYAWKSK